jgi:hypothetical protein
MKERQPVALTEAEAPDEATAAKLRLEFTLSDIGGVLGEKNVHPLTLKALHAVLVTEFPTVKIEDIENSRKNAFVLL